MRLTGCVLPPGSCELPRAVRCALLAWCKTAGCANADAFAPILQMGRERITRLIFTFRSRAEDNRSNPAASCTTNCVKCSNLPCVQTSAHKQCEEIYEILATNAHCKQLCSQVICHQGRQTAHALRLSLHGGFFSFASPLDRSRQDPNAIAGLYMNS